MKILTVSGSARPESSNVRLLRGLATLLPQEEWTFYEYLDQLPLFLAQLDANPIPPEVLRWREAVTEADALIICIPEYLHNLPALIKNALEWITSSGNLYQKPVLAITYTPHPPRGEKAMQSLLWSLGALEARVVASLPLYQSELIIDMAGKITAEEETLEMIQVAIDLLK